MRCTVCRLSTLALLLYICKCILTVHSEMVFWLLLHSLADCSGFLISNIYYTGFTSREIPASCVSPVNEAMAGLQLIIYLAQHFCRRWFHNFYSCFEIMLFYCRAQVEELQQYLGNTPTPEQHVHMKNEVSQYHSLVCVLYVVMLCCEGISTSCNYIYIILPIIILSEPEITVGHWPFSDHF